MHTYKNYSTSTIKIKGSTAVHINVLAQITVMRYHYACYSFNGRTAYQKDDHMFNFSLYNQELSLETFYEKICTIELGYGSLWG